MDDDLYNVTAERLWEKLEYHRSNIDITCVDFKKPFPIDQLSSKNPIVREFIKEVENEYNYSMSEFQTSWAVVQLVNGGAGAMCEYNINNHTRLLPRP